jgi:hypothetical protein
VINWNVDTIIMGLPGTIVPCFGSHSRTNTIDIPSWAFVQATWTTSSTVRLSKNFSVGGEINLAEGLREASRRRRDATMAQLNVIFAKSKPSLTTI